MRIKLVINGWEGDINQLIADWEGEIDNHKIHMLLNGLDSQMSVYDMQMTLRRLKTSD